VSGLYTYSGNPSTRKIQEKCDGNKGRISLNHDLEMADEMKLEALEERLEFLGCWWEVATGDYSCLTDPK